MLMQYKTFKKNIFLGPKNILKSLKIPKKLNQACFIYVIPK